MIPLEALCSHWVSVYFVPLSVLVRGRLGARRRGSSAVRILREELSAPGWTPEQQRGLEADAQPITPALGCSCGRGRITSPCGTSVFSAIK